MWYTVIVPPKWLLRGKGWQPLSLIGKYLWVLLNTLHPLYLKGELGNSFLCLSRISTYNSCWVPTGPKIMTESVINIEISNTTDTYCLLTEDGKSSLVVETMIFDTNIHKKNKFWLVHNCLLLPSYSCRGVARLSIFGGKERCIFCFFYYFFPFFLDFSSFSS